MRSNKEYELFKKLMKEVRYIIFNYFIYLENLKYLFPNYKMNLDKIYTAKN